MKKAQFDEIVTLLEDQNSDITERSIPCFGGVVKIFYIRQMTDRTALVESAVKPLVLYCSSNKKCLNAQMTLDTIIFADDCTIESDMSKIHQAVLSGMTVILFSTDNAYIVANFKKIERRSVPTPSLTYTIRGPQDCFIENLDVNLSLIRYRVKDKNLQIEIVGVGARTRTKVAIVYIKDIANDDVVNEVQKRIQCIDIDGIGESGELQAFLLNNKMQLFPQMGLIERSDVAFHSLLEGKVLVLADGSGMVLLAPKTFNEFFYSCDDRYDNKFFGAFARFLRYLSITLALTGSSLFIAVTSFHTDVLPSDYAILLAEMRSTAPFNALIAALILELTMELLREALLRVPKQIGSAIGIVGAIVIGQAAISAGIFSPLILIIAAVSLLASFAIPDYTMVTPFRILKFFLMLATGTLGFLGFTMVITLIVAELVSMDSFGVPYMAPWAPFNAYDFIRTFIQSITMNPKRPHYLRDKDTTKTSKQPYAKNTDTGAGDG